MRSPLIMGAKAVIVVLLGALIACQVWVVPMIAAGFARTAPEFGQLETPGIILVGALLACGELVLVCVWRLLTLASRDSVFDPQSLCWVNTIVGSVAAAGAIVVFGLIVIGDARAGNPFLALMGALALITILGLVLVVLVMRSLLEQTMMRQQALAEVA